MRLKWDKMSSFCKLDFAKEGWLVRDLTPHGAAATARNAQGELKFVVWNRY